jgi:hypothetical protein
MLILHQKDPRNPRINQLAVGSGFCECGQVEVLDADLGGHELVEERAE